MNGGITVQRVCKMPGIPASSQLVRFAQAALAGHSPAARMTVRVVDEAEGSMLNARYRLRDSSIDRATNVLAFPFDPPGVAPSADREIGDVVICAPVVAREAISQSKSLEAHWALMVVHGTLHLLGYDHEQPDAAAVMEALECDLMIALGYPDPYEADEAQRKGDAARCRTPTPNRPETTRIHPDLPRPIG
ncbi:rRNA maturation RNase YbeY [Thioalkalivibrio sp. HK1]|uniref:rRNA maturation RNase YbeY n=1 Tax=Thioalkalivibrio sp. HK1 TaxID=1469245 RepID=UPI000470F2DD|nr:rRNA maturation RNase YbeY [Thioalkalivibrio sp. HK1]